MSSAATAGAGRRASAEGRAATEKRQESAKGPGNRGQRSNREAPDPARVCEGASEKEKEGEKKMLLSPPLWPL